MDTLDQEERIIILEKKQADLLCGYETLADLIDQHQKMIQRSITELSAHFMKSMEPKIRRIVRDEIERSKS